uniref:Uncharacterized protein n=1 Tax=Panagrolaimus sp. PS1159 TaxID=55785 RepID=A0AC35FQX4_9BILA
MESTDFLSEVKRKYVQVFELQNPNLLDVVFEIEGRAEFVSYELISPNEIFQGVYDWAEVQAVKKQKESSDENF